MIANPIVITCNHGEALRWASKASSYGLSRSYLVLLQYHRSPFWGDLGAVGQGDGRPLGSTFNGDMDVASNMTTDSDPFLADRAYCVQALIMMALTWKRGKWECALPEATTHLDCQLGVSSVYIDRWNTSGDQLQLAVAANLLSKSLPFLNKPETDVDTTVKIKLKEVLDTICGPCGELDARDLPHELRGRSADSAEVMRVSTLQ